ncbi:hypothetical protein BGZ75_009940 [Mortierella antarctica]|nr:hypothetical protein BGZ75_009940 [Mortierella antarctica]
MVLPHYMTWKPTPGAIGHDVLQHLWKPLGNAYLCPPWNLIPLALQKIKQERIKATIVTPHWPSAHHLSQFLVIEYYRHQETHRTFWRRTRTPLVILRLEDKRRRLMAKAWDPATASIIFRSPSMKRRLKQYAATQDRYIKWAVGRGVDPMEPQPSQLLNWLASGVVLNKWTSGTVSAYKAAVIHMYEDKSAFDEPDFQLFFLALCTREIKHTKELDIDLKPVVEYLQEQGPNEELSVMNLTQKLCWLLGTCGFLRANDILCIDLSNDKFHVDRIAAVLPILLPKETRGGNRICKYITIKSLDDPLLCPV